MFCNIVRVNFEAEEKSKDFNTIYMLTTSLTPTKHQATFAKKKNHCLKMTLKLKKMNKNSTQQQLLRTNRVRKKSH